MRERDRQTGRDRDTDRQRQTRGIGELLKKRNQSQLVFTESGVDLHSHLNMIL